MCLFMCMCVCGVCLCGMCVCIVLCVCVCGVRVCHTEHEHTLTSSTSSCVLRVTKEDVMCRGTLTFWCNFLLLDFISSRFAVFNFHSNLFLPPPPPCYGISICLRIIYAFLPLLPRNLSPPFFIISLHIGESYFQLLIRVEEWNYFPLRAYLFIYCLHFLMSTTLSLIPSNNYLFITLFSGFPITGDLTLSLMK